MYIPKRYGQSKTDKCPFCGMQATMQNSDGVPVCRKHTGSSLGDMMCACGEPLELRNGKFGPYFFCESCGNINFRKALEMNEGRINRKREPELRPRNPRKFEEIKSKIGNEKNGPKEFVVRSDEVDFMFE